MTTHFSLFTRPCLKRPLPLLFYDPISSTSPFLTSLLPPWPLLCHASCQARSHLRVLQRLFPLSDMLFLQIPALFTLFPPSALCSSTTFSVRPLCPYFQFNNILSGISLPVLFYFLCNHRHVTYYLLHLFILFFICSYLSCIGEGHGNPLQYSCLENPRNGEAWWAAVYGVAQSRTRLK